MANPSVLVRLLQSPKQPLVRGLATRLAKMLEAFERWQRARADRVIRHYAYLGARAPEIEERQDVHKATKPMVAAPSQRPLLVGVSP